MSTQIIDLETFETLKSMKNATFLQELIDLYLSDSIDQISDMRLTLANDKAAA